MALNAPIQGSAADIIKVAMLEVEAGAPGRRAVLVFRLLLQVHDELVLEVAPGELGPAVEDLVRREMAGAYPLPLPRSTCRSGTGCTWDDAAH